MAAEDTVDTIISNAIARSEQAQNKAEAYADDAINVANTQAVPSDPGSIAGPPSEPTLEEPSTDLGDLFEGEADAKADEILSKIDGDFLQFLEDYFPGLGSLTATAINWIDDAITNGGTGIATDVENQIWNRERNRQEITNREETDAAEDEVVRRGWSLPNGAVTERIRIAGMTKRDRISESSRTVAIEQAKLEQNNVQFAVSQAVRLRLGVIQAALAFVDQTVRAYLAATDHSRSLAAATEAFYNQSVQYYATKLRYEELNLLYEETDFNAELAVQKLGADVIADRARNSANAAMEAAKAMANVAAAAIGSQNTMGSLISETVTEN